MGILKRKSKADNTETMYKMFYDYFSSSFWNESDPVRLSYKKAMENEAVWTCTRVISETISNFPLKVYEKKAGHREGRADHFLNSLFTDPTEDIDGKIYKQLILQHLLVKGNHYSFIERNRASGRVIKLHPLDPDKMTVHRNESGEKYFKYNNELYDRTQIFHVMGYSANGLNGLSPVDLFKASIIEGIDADQFIARFWKRGNFSKLGYKFPAGENITPEKIKAVQEQFRKHFLGIENSYLPIAFPDGTELKEIKSYSLKDDDVLELRKQAILKIASIYSVPPHFLNIMDNANYSNITAMNENFYKITLLPWIIRLEKAIEKQLLPGYEKGVIYTKFNASSLLRSNDKDRAGYYAVMLNKGIMNLNQVCALEDLPPIECPEANYNFIPVNMIAIQKYNELQKVNKE